MSVAYAENQSMFLDSLVGDGAWRAKYARNRSGEPLPFALHEEELRATHPFEVFMLRSMLSVPYFEKALYELPEAELTPEGIQKLADHTEIEVQGGLAARPLLSVPHIISDEASCYYHGYVLAEMSVHQTREFFLKSGPIVDNPVVGRTLTTSYWAPGNSEMFLDLVAKLTGKPLTGDAWIESLQENIDTKVAAERKEYEESLAEAKATKETGGAVELNMHVQIKDGDTLIADSSRDGGFLQSCKVFETYIRKRYFKSEAV